MVYLPLLACCVCTATGTHPECRQRTWTPKGKQMCILYQGLVAWEGLVSESLMPGSVCCASHAADFHPIKTSSLLRRWRQSFGMRRYGYPVSSELLPGRIACCTSYQFPLLCANVLTSRVGSWKPISKCVCSQITLALAWSKFCCYCALRWTTGATLTLKFYYSWSWTS